VTKWSLDNVHIFSSSDDKTVRYWDLPTEKEIQIMKGHQVRPMPLSRARGGVCGLG
jgi:WD40 repeat protein